VFLADSVEIAGLSGSVVLLTGGRDVSIRFRSLLAAATRQYNLTGVPEFFLFFEKICGGKPQRPRFTKRPVARVKWVDGTVLDTVWQLAD
jgi:citrate lyase alpha subunit